MANKIPAYYAQETIRLVAQPRPELQALLDQHHLPRALPGSDRVEGEMDAESYGRLFMSLLRLLQKDLHPDPDLVLDLSSYRLLYAYMSQSENLGDAIETCERCAGQFKIIVEASNRCIEDASVAPQL